MANAVGVFKVEKSPEGKGRDLTKHLPIELSRVLRNILSWSNFEERKREMGLVVPGRFQARTNWKKVSDVMNTKIKMIKKRYSYFEPEIEQMINKPLLNTTIALGTKIHYFDVTVNDISI